MRAVTGSLLGSKSISISRASSIITAFTAAAAAADANFIRRDSAAFLRRAANAFSDLSVFHKHLRAYREESTNKYGDRVEFDKENSGKVGTKKMGDGIGDSETVEIEVSSLKFKQRIKSFEEIDNKNQEIVCSDVNCGDKKKEVEFLEEIGDGEVEQLGVESSKKGVDCEETNGSNKKEKKKKNNRRTEFVEEIGDGEVEEMVEQSERKRRCHDERIGSVGEDAKKSKKTITKKNKFVEEIGDGEVQEAVVEGLKKMNADARGGSENIDGKQAKKRRRGDAEIEDGSSRIKEKKRRRKENE